MRSINDIKSILHQNKEALFSKYPISNMAIFGSYARNENHEHSDVDILVDFNQNIGIRFIDFGDELEKLIGAKVDIVTRKGIKDKYYKAIQKDLIYV